MYTFALDLAFICSCFFSRGIFYWMICLQCFGSSGWPVGMSCRNDISWQSADSAAWTLSVRLISASVTHCDSQRLTLQLLRVERMLVVRFGCW